MSYIDDYLPICTRFEGSVPFMYLDSVGHVTVGVGLMLPTVYDAIALPFQDDDGPAPTSAISSEYYRVQMMPVGYRASFYLGPLSLTNDVIQAHLRQAVTDVDTHLRIAVKGYDDLPDSWKLGLLDMGFNLGVTGLMTKFPHFMQAIDERNGQAAEAQCNRPQLSLARNDWTRQCFASVDGV